MTTRTYNESDPARKGQDARACVRGGSPHVDHDAAGVCNPCVDAIQSGAPSRLPTHPSARAAQLDLETDRAATRAATSGPAYRCDACRDKSTRCGACRARRAAAKSALRARKRDAGACLECDAPATSGGRCDRHREASNASSRAAHARKRAPKVYAHDGRVGCVALTKSRVSGTTIGVYHAAQAGIDADPDHPWVVACETHGQTVSTATLTDARRTRNSADFCDECRAAEADRDVAVYVATRDEYRGYECSACGGKLGRKCWEGNRGVYCTKRCASMPRADEDR